MTAQAPITALNPSVDWPPQLRAAAAAVGVVLP